MREIDIGPAEAQPPADGATPDETDGATLADPLRFCVFTTVALIAWVFGPPLAVTLMSGLGLWAFGRAWRRGLRRSRCRLRDVRLVLIYLGAAFVLGVAFGVRGLLIILERAGVLG